MSQKFELVSFRTPDDLAKAAAAAWLDEIETANRAEQQHHAALSGGRITQKFFASVVEQAKMRKVSFAQVHFFWADERCLPPTDSESNFKLANDLLFTPLKISMEQIHRLRGEDNPEAAAESAEKEIRRFISAGTSGQPLLDLIFLGLGEDGHVASLAPGEPDIWESDKAVYRAIHNFPKPPPDRLTLGYQAIAAARQVWMLASGSAKEQPLRESLSLSDKTSFGRVLRLRAATKVFTDIAL